MKPRLAALTLLTLFAAIPAAIAAPVAAPVAAPERPVAPAAERPLTVVAQAGRAAPVSERILVTAAGSVLVLADGVVVQARFAQIAPPAPGFVYER